MPDLPQTHVRETDAFTFRMEGDPLLRSTITARRSSSTAPRTGTSSWTGWSGPPAWSRPSGPSSSPSPFGLAPPSWVLDADFDLSWHLRRVDAPAPHTFETLLEMARVAGMTAFDPARPLWEFTLVSGLTDGGAALLMKVHHALTDGVGGIDLAAHVVDLQREPADLGPMPAVPRGQSHGSAARLGESLGFELSRWARTACSLATAAPGAAVHLVRHPVQTATSVAETTASIARFVRPVPTTMSPVMTERRLQWSFGILDVPFKRPQGRRPVRRRIAQRCLPGRHNRWAAALPRAPRVAGARAAGDDADQHPQARRSRRAATASPSCASRCRSP